MEKTNLETEPGILGSAVKPESIDKHLKVNHITVTRQALAQLPFRTSGAVGKKVLIRTDGAGGTHAFLQYLTARKLSYSVGFTLTDAMAQAVDDISRRSVDTGGSIRAATFATEPGSRN